MSISRYYSYLINILNIISLNEWLFFMFALPRKQQVTPKHQFTYRQIADVNNLRDHCHENVK